MTRRTGGVLAAAASLLALASAAPAYAADSCVNTTGSGGCFTSIDDAIADAGTGNGDTITVAAGTYQEDQVLVDKGVSIIGAGAGKTIIDGNDASLGSTGVLRLTGNADQTVRGLSIREIGGVGTTRDG